MPIRKAFVIVVLSVRPSLLVPLYLRILIGVVLGTIVGAVTPWLTQWQHCPSLISGFAGTAGQIGLLVVRMLKALATPLILFAVIDAFLHTRIPPSKGARLFALSALNAVVAIVIGLVVANLLNAGAHAKGDIAMLMAHVDTSKVGKPPPDATLDFITNISGYIPESLVDPFAKNSVISVVILAILIGSALRHVRDRSEKASKTDPYRGPETTGVNIGDAVKTVEHIVKVALLSLVQILEWVIQLMPYAVFGIVARVVKDTGVGVYANLGLFMLVVLLGLFIHVVIWYGILRAALRWKGPMNFYRGAADAIVTALSSGSSLATLPVTLKCLDDKLKVSHGSSRLAAIVGTNLNHDGIILYEAAAALFLSQAFGHSLDVSTQISIAIASVMAGIGIAGVPEAGLITLPLVLGAAHLPPAVVGIAAPLMFPVDWILGRFRAVTNVVSDMTVAIALDQLDRRNGTPPGTDGDVSANPSHPTTPSVD